jgi:hypothetical protein
MHIPVLLPSSDKHSSSTENDGKKFITKTREKKKYGKEKESEKRS